MIWYSQGNPGAYHHEINLIDMIPLAKGGLWNDQLHNSMTLWEISIPNLSLLGEISMKMNEVKRFLNMVKIKILEIEISHLR